MTVSAFPPRDPVFALAPELELHFSKVDGQLVVNSREVARVFFRGRHRRLLRKILQDMWHMPVRLDCGDQFRLRADDSIDMTSDGLARALCHWGFRIRNKRLDQFNWDWAQLMCKAADEIEAKTGINPITKLFEEKFGPLRYFTDDGRQCCDDCHLPEPAGPMLHAELWASIAKEPDAFLCLDCIEKRLGRRLTQADLKWCAFNAGWISFDGADVAAMQFAHGRRLLPEGGIVTKGKLLVQIPRSGG